MSVETMENENTQVNLILGFSWKQPKKLFSLSSRLSKKEVMYLFDRSAPLLIWDAAQLEGNPCTFEEVQTLLDGITVGGRKVTDQQQVLNLANATKCLKNKVLSGSFMLEKEIFTQFNALIAKEESLEWGNFRGEGKATLTPNVSLGDETYTPPKTEVGAKNLNSLFDKGCELLKTMPPVERAMAFFLFGALQQFFYDGNKRTSRFMMNGELMSHRFPPISIPAKRRLGFNTKMIGFYKTKDATDMIDFIFECGDFEMKSSRPMVKTNNENNDKWFDT